MGARRFVLLRGAVRAALLLAGGFVAISLCIYMAIGQPLLRALYQSVGGYWKFVSGLPPLWQKAAPVALSAYLHSLLALVAAFGMALLVASVLGLWVGMRPASRLSTVVRLAASLGTITPSFILALLIMIAFVLYLFPLTGIRFILLFSETAFDPRRLLPIALTLAVRPLALFTTVAASAASRAVLGDYVRTAHSKGLARRQVTWRHIWPNVWPDVVSAIPPALLFALSSLPIVEFVFNWPGIGLTLLRSAGGPLVPGVSQAALITFLFAAVGLSYVLVTLAIQSLQRALYPALRQPEGV